MKYKTNPTQSDLLASNLRTQIVDGEYKPGGRMPTFQEIETSFQVSRGVVQQAIAKLKQDGFVNAQSRRGGLYVVENPPHLKRYAVITPTNRDSSCWSLFNEILLKECHLYEQNHEGCEFELYLGLLDVKDGMGICQKLKEEIESHRLAGLIMTPETFDTIHELLEVNIPKVYINSHISQNYHPSVVDDTQGFIDRSLKWFADHGRSRVAVVHMSDTYDGLGEADFVRAGLPFHSQWIQQVGRNAPVVVKNLIPLLMDYPKEQRPDGLLIADDNLVEYAASAVIAMGLRVGQDLDIIAHCNWPWAVPNIIPMQRIGFHAGNMLERCIEQIDNQRSNKPIIPFQEIPALFENEV